MWTVAHLDDLTPRQVHELYRVRVAVFVCEQACPYPEIDKDDASCLHIFAEDEQGVYACARLIATPECIKLGRVLVRKDRRHEGLGRRLVSKALDVSEQYYPGQRIYAQAQAYLEDFYASFGFVRHSETYLEDGIPHIDMYRES